jgi:hypothetical protein
MERQRPAADDCFVHARQLETDPQTRGGDDAGFDFAGVTTGKYFPTAFFQLQHFGQLIRSRSNGGWRALNITDTNSTSLAQS